MKRIAEALNVARSRLAERLACVKSNITHLGDRLEADNLVKRLADRDDRRIILAAITDAGRQRFTKGIETEARIEQQLFGSFPSEDRSRLLALLGQLNRRA